MRLPKVSVGACTVHVCGLARHLSGWAWPHKEQNVAERWGAEAAALVVSDRLRGSLCIAAQVHAGHRRLNVLHGSSTEVCA